MTLKQSILNYLQDKDWMSKGDILLRTWTIKDKQVMADTVSRTLRRMEEEKLIAVKYLPPKKTVYKVLPQEYRAIYIPVSERQNVNKLFK